MGKKKTKDNQYNYPSFKVKYYDHSIFAGPKPGETAPDFTAYTLDGKPVSLYSLLDKPLVLETGSITCPIYTGKIKSMQTIWEKYPMINFVVLYIREAHPGSNIPSHKTQQEKDKRAQELQKNLEENRMILVDDLEGTGHKLYGLLPDMIYFIDTDGTILYRAKWNRPDDLDKILQAYTTGKPIPETESTRFNWGDIHWNALWRGGFSAIWDFLKEMPGRIWDQWKLERKEAEEKRKKEEKKKE